MTLDGGDRKFGHGDEMTVTNAEGSTINEGDLVYVSGYDSGGDRPEVSLANGTNSTGYDAVVKTAQDSDGVEDGEYAAAVFRGAPYVRVDSATAGNGVSASTSNAGRAEDSGSSAGDGEPVFLSGVETLNDGNDSAVVLLR